MNQLHSDYWIHVSALLRVYEEPVFTANHERFITSRSQTYPQFGIIRRTGGERLRDGKGELPFQLFREGSRGRPGPHDGHKDGEAEPGQF